MNWDYNYMCSVQAVEQLMKTGMPGMCSKIADI